MRNIVPIIILTFTFARSELIKPSHLSNLNHIHVLFEWEQIPEATQYDIQISTSSDFTVDMFIIRRNTLIYIDKENINWENTYFWRIRPVFNAEVGSWTDTYSFSTGTSLSSSSVNTFEDCCYDSGLTVFGAFFNYFSAALDENGKEIWNTGEENFVYYSSNEYGNIFGCTYMPGTENNLPGSEITFQREIIWQEPNDEFLHHDLIRLPNGNYLGIIETETIGPIPIGDWSVYFLGLGFSADGITNEFPWIGDKLVEWDKDTKEVVWTWSVFDHFNMSDYDQIGGTWGEAYLNLHYDWTHVNAVIFDEEESAIYISARHLSRITKIDYPSGNVIWNLGHQMPSDEVTMGTDIGFSFQHSLQLLENGNILTFDNGNLSESFRGTNTPISRAIEISINNNQAALEWEYELEPDLFGFASGNAQKLSNGNVLMTTIGGGGRSLEVDEVGNIIWEANYNLSLPDGAVYRAHRIPGLFPIAFSVIHNDFQEQNGDIGVYLAPGSSSISYTLANDSDYPITLSCNIADDAGWFGSQTTTININANSNESLSFTGEIENSNHGNSIHLTVTPVNHSYGEKTISIDGFTYPLSVDINIEPNTFKLGHPYPNPFNASTSIEYELENDQNIQIEIYNINGLLITTLFRGWNKQGSYKLNWESNNNPSGLYFIRMQSNTHLQTQKVLLLK